MPPTETAQQLIDLIIEETSGYGTLERRIIANRIIGVLSGWLPESSKKEAAGVLVMEPLTDDEARKFGQFATMEFGKYEGHVVDQVPMEYLEWLADRSRVFWKSMHRYLNSPRIKRERED